MNPAAAAQAGNLLLDARQTQAVRTRWCVVRSVDGTKERRASGAGKTTAIVGHGDAQHRAANFRIDPNPSNSGRRSAFYGVVQQV